MIAVDMLIHTVRRNMSEATLIAGDADFTPLLNALSNEGMFVNLIHPPRASRDLRSAADARQLLTVYQVYSWLDQASREVIGPVATPSFGMESHTPNSQHLWTCPDGRDVQVWWELGGKWPWVSWPAPGRTDRFSLTGGTWSHTRKTAMGDYGVELPGELDAVVAELMR